MVDQEESGNAVNQMSWFTARTISDTSCCDKFPWTTSCERRENHTRTAVTNSSKRQIAVMRFPREIVVTELTKIT